MPVYNSDVAKIFERVADLLEIEGANEYRVRAYREAARTISTLSMSVQEMVEGGEDLTRLSGIGEDLAAKIEEIVESGELGQLEEIKERTPAELAAMLKIPGLGPKRVETMHEELGISDLDDLLEAAESGEIQELEGLGPKTQEQIREKIDAAREDEQRTLLSVADEMVQPLVDFVANLEGVRRVVVAGSYRRRKQTVGDIDILATGGEGERIIAAFGDYEDIVEVQSQGETRSTVRLRPGLQVDLRVVPEESYGAALVYFTGSKEHNIALRNLALDQDRKINEYGVFEDDQRIAGEDEAAIYALFDMAFIEPELREDRGELVAAREGKLPQLVTLDDLRGDLQAHTHASDGGASLKEMARGAQHLGHEYLAITDHSPHIGVAQGLDAEELAERIGEINALDAEMEDIQLLKGIEVDILEDGALDLPDDILAKLDICIFAVHSHFGLSKQHQTERILRAMDNPNVHILAHPTGRIINEREAYDLDLDRVMEGAVDRGCYLEINAQPDRLDIDDIACKRAKALGLKLAISTDAHSVDELEALQYGVHQARRGWLEPEDILNTRPWDQLQDLLER